MNQEVEPNATLAAANALTLGTAITGQLSAASDVDTYKFTVSAAGVVSIAFDSPLSSSLDYFGFGLYDSSGSILGFYRTGQDRTISAAAPAAGTYYVGVFSSTYYSNGNYSLTVNHTAGSTAGFESEANGGFATADSLTLGTAITGQLSDSADIDTFKFTVSAAGTVSRA